MENLHSLKLNGESIGSFWSVPFKRLIPVSRLKSKNILVLEVANLDANRVIQMDREEVPWKNFHEINFVNIRYEPFDASLWEPLPSGLLGPVTISPVSLD